MNSSPPVQGCLIFLVTVVGLSLTLDRPLRIRVPSATWPGSFLSSLPLNTLAMEEPTQPLLKVDRGGKVNRRVHGVQYMHPSSTKKLRYRYFCQLFSRKTTLYPPRWAPCPSLSHSWDKVPIFSFLRTPGQELQIKKKKKKSHLSLIETNVMDPKRAEERGGGRQGVSGDGPRARWKQYTSHLGMPTFPSPNGTQYLHKREKKEGFWLLGRCRPPSSQMRWAGG